MSLDKSLIKAAENGDVVSLKKLIAGGLSPIGLDKAGNSLLHISAEKSSLDACKVLVEAGCDVNQKNSKGKTPFDVAEKKKKGSSVSQYLKQIQLVPRPSSPGLGGGGGAASGRFSIVIAATVDVYKYDHGAQTWAQSESETVPIELHNCPHPYAFKLLLKKKSSPVPIVDANFTKDSQYIKATETFHNFQDGGNVWGFNFVNAAEAGPFFKALEDAKEKLKNPPPPPAVVPVAAPIAAPVASAAPPSAPPPGGAPPPPPPPPAAAPMPNLSVGGGKQLSLAEQLASKKSSGLKNVETDQSHDSQFDDHSSDGAAAGATLSRPTSVGVGGGGGGGNIMSELANRLKKRQEGPPAGGSGPIQPAGASTAAAPTTSSAINPPGGLRKTAPNKVISSAVVSSGVSSGGSSGVSSGGTTVPNSRGSSAGPSKEEFESFKEALITGFRNELRIIKEEIIASINA